jgi:hypothetical protein
LYKKLKTKFYVKKTKPLRKQQEEQREKKETLPMHLVLIIHPLKIKYMIKQTKMTVSAADSYSQVAAGLTKISKTKKTRKMKPAKMSVKERLSLKEINEFDFDFDDVIENVDKLMCHYFKGQKQSIEKIVSGLYFEHRSKINYEYDKFIRIASKGKDFKDWFEMHNQFVEGKDEVANSILDLYFQMNMVPSYDVYNDVLIHAYLEDVQPYLN